MKDADILKIQMGFVSSVKQKYIDFGPVTLTETLTRIEWGFEDSAQKIELIRRLSCGTDEDMAKAKTLKLKLPAVLPHAVLKKGAVRAKNKSFDLTGFVHMDIDSDAKSASSEAIKQALQAMNFPPIVCFTSPSGAGCKAIWLVEGLASASKALSAPEKTDLFGKAWDFVADLTNATLAPLGLEVDQAPKSPLSTFFLSFDKCTVNLKCKKIDWASISTATVTPVKNSKISQSSTKKQASPKPVKSLAPSQPSSLPSFNAVQPMLQFLSASKQIKAWAAIEKYFGLKIGLGLRYFGFFEMASMLCVLGKKGGLQAWKEPVFEELLKVLDYDGSRLKKNQIASAISSLKAYGHFTTQSTVSSQATYPPTHTSETFAHLKRLAETDVVLTTKRFLADLHSDLLRELADHRVMCLQAPTGTGKSTYFLSVLPQHIEGHIFFVVPLVALRTQLVAKFKHLGFIEEVAEGGMVSRDKKVHICTPEKLITMRSDIQKGDLIVVDESHLLGDDYRKPASKIILSWVDEAQLADVKWVFTSGTLQHFSVLAKECLASTPRTIQVLGPRKPKHLEISITENPMKLAKNRVEEILAQDPTAKILIFKNDKSDLADLQNALQYSAVKSLIFSRDTREDAEVAALLETGKTPQAPVVLATSSASVGIELLFITHTICLGTIPTELLIQVLDRNRRDDAPCELIIEKSPQQNAEFYSFLRKKFIKDRLKEVRENLKVELGRLKTAIGKLEGSQGELNKFFSGVYTFWKDFPDMPICDTVMPKITKFSAVARHLDKYSIDLCTQGLIKNFGKLEYANERHLDYFRLKLTALWGMGSKVHFVDSGPRLPKDKDSDVWTLLREKIKSLPASHEIRDACDAVLTTAKIEKIRAAKTLRVVEHRLEWLKANALDESHYIFLAEDDWLRLRHVVLMRFCGKTAYPIQWAVTDFMKKHNFFGAKLSAEACVDILKKTPIPPEAGHIKEAILGHSPQQISAFFRSFLDGESHRVKIAGKRTRVLEALKPAWEGLVHAKNVHADDDDGLDWL